MKMRLTSTPPRDEVYALRIRSITLGFVVALISYLIGGSIAVPPSSLKEPMSEPPLTTFTKVVVRPQVEGVMKAGETLSNVTLIPLNLTLSILVFVINTLSAFFLLVPFLVLRKNRVKERWEARLGLIAPLIFYMIIFLKTGCAAQILSSGYTELLLVPHTYLEFLGFSLVFSFSYQIMRNYWDMPLEEVEKISVEVRSWRTIHRLLPLIPLLLLAAFLEINWMV